MSSTRPSVLPSRRPIAVGALALLAAAGLAACGSNEDHSQHAGHDANGSPTAGTTAGTSSAPASTASTGGPATTGAATSPLVVSQAWAKALPEPAKMMGMTAVFGDLVNRGGTPVTITSAATSASDHTELHQTVGGKMSPVTSFTVPAGGTFSLKPGGNHVMVMDVKKPIRPGDLVKVTLTTADGQKVEFSAVAKTFTGAGEKYAK